MPEQSNVTIIINGAMSREDFLKSVFMTQNQILYPSELHEQKRSDISFLLELLYHADIRET